MQYFQAHTFCMELEPSCRLILNLFPWKVQLQLSALHAEGSILAIIRWDQVRHAPTTLGSCCQSVLPVLNEMEQWFNLGWSSFLNTTCSTRVDVCLYKVASNYVLPPQSVATEYHFLGTGSKWPQLHSSTLWEASQAELLQMSHTHTPRRSTALIP